MKKLTFFTVLLLALTFSLLAGCGGSTPSSNPPGGTQANTVTMSGVQFDSTSITVTKGSTITFTTATGGAAHNLVVGMSGQPGTEQGAPDFGSGGMTVAAGASWTTPPWNTAGTYHVTCTFHPTSMTMTRTAERRGGKQCCNRS